MKMIELCCYVTDFIASRRRTETLMLSETTCAVSKSVANFSYELKVINFQEIEHWMALFSYSQ